MERGLLVGRFQPFHLGHLYAIKYALKHAERLIIVIGSAQFSYTLKNPFTAGERIEMISNSLEEEEIRGPLIIPVDDTYERNFIWVRHVENYTPCFDVVFSNDPLTRQLFSDAGYSVKKIPFYKREEISGTRIRRLMSEGEEWEGLVPHAVKRVIEKVGGVERIKMLFRISQRQ